MNRMAKLDRIQPSHLSTFRTFMKQRLSFFNDEDQSRWNGVRGWLLPSAAECLHRYAKESSSDGQILEIGSYAGKSSVCIGRAIRDKKQLMTCIDLRFQPDFRRNLADFGADTRVSLLEGASLDHFESWDSPVSFLYIDGHHGKGYALADLLLWDMFVLPGGFVALDDTAGFMIGPNMQVQAMTTAGGYEFLEERGGISFLRKNRGLSPLVCHEPTAAVWFAKLHVTSSNLGATDPLFRCPRLPHQPTPISEWIDRFWHTSPSETLHLVRRKIRRLKRKVKTGGANPSNGPPTVRITRKTLDWLRASQNVAPNAAPTLDYLDACRMMREGNLAEASALLLRLSKISDSIMLSHYRLPVASVSKLRLAQCHDLMGKREEAARRFGELATDETDPLLRDAAKLWISERFVIPGGENSLLREYNLAWLDRKTQTPPQS